MGPIGNLRFRPVRGVALAGALSVLAVTGRSRADPAAAEARAAYDAGAAAYDAHEYARAAALFAHADELAPNPLVLKLGLAAAMQTDDAPLAMTLALRADARAVDGSIAELAKQAHRRFGGRVGALRLVCAAHRGCRAHAGDTPLVDGEIVALLPGEVDATFDDATPAATRRLTIVAGRTLDLVELDGAPQATPHVEPLRDHAPPSSPSPVRKPLPPAVFWTGAGLTAVAAAATIGSGLDTVSRHDAFERDRTADAKDRGESAQLRTNVLLAVTIASALTTGVIGALFTRWGRTPAAAAAATSDAPEGWARPIATF